MAAAEIAHERGSAVEMADFAREWTNLAQPRLGAAAIAASDEFFAPKERLLLPEEPVFIPDTYDEHGKWMDGWETRRKRAAGHDWCVVRLARPGWVHGVELDTRHFTGNYPPAASLDACASGGAPDETTAWTTIVPPTPLAGDARRQLPVAAHGPWTHVRLNIYPDGGVARLRVYGRVAVDWAALDPREPLDLAALLHGGRVVAASDAHYGGLDNLLLPGRGLNMGDGWETRRRREPGHDWVIIALGGPGVVRAVELDTAHYKGNYPARASIQAAQAPGVPALTLVAQSMFWPTLLPEQPLGPDRQHTFERELRDLGPVTHARVNIIPDGGLSRVRLVGTPAAG